MKYNSTFIPGLRGLKIALRVSANRLLTETNVTEENLIYRSLLDVNLPKINSQDITIFKRVINDLFPNAITGEKNYEWLRQEYERRCKEKDYQPVESLYRKLVESYEMSGYRQGLMLIGNPYTGKSFVLRTLIDAIKSMKQLVNDDMDLGMHKKIITFLI